MELTPTPWVRPSPARQETAFGCPRDFLGNKFVYTVVSPRAQGLSVGVNLSPDKRCDFNCIYCEVDRRRTSPQVSFDAQVMIAELKMTLAFIQDGGLRQRPCYRRLPEELLQLRHVAISGDGEPTLSAFFTEALQAILHLRALNEFPFFKVVLITNASGLDRPEVLSALKQLTVKDEVWAKLDGGTQAYVDRVNRPEVPLEHLLENILKIARKRPVIIQSLFPALDEQDEAPPAEVDSYANRLLELKKAGAQIPLVQIYSATRPTPCSECDHLPLKALSRIAQTVRQTAGLRAEVF